MEPLFALLNRRGLLLIFLWVLVEQAGIPLPAPPILVTAGALAQEGAWRPEWVVATVVAACLIADHAWFIAGRLRGRVLLASICRLSLSPDTCVRKTDDLISRHGANLTSRQHDRRDHEPGGGGAARRADRLPDLGRRRRFALRRAPAAPALSEALLGKGRLDLVFAELRRAPRRAHPPGRRSR